MKNEWDLDIQFYPILSKTFLANHIIIAIDWQEISYILTSEAQGLESGW